MNKVIIISGATATGKSSLAIELAKEIQTQINKKAVIINFDSLLFYRELNIGTAKPTTEEMQSIEHSLIDIASISDPLNASVYAKKALEIINQCHFGDNIPILVGGSGFYLDALIHGMYDSPTTPIEIQEKSDQLYKEKGIGPFLYLLKENDLESFKNLHPNDHYRVRRAIEHFWSHGNPISWHKKNKKKNNPQNWNIHHIYLEIPKEDHLKIIKKRTLQMIQSGLVDEVRQILRMGFNGEEKPLKSIGYKETILFLQNKIKDIPKLVELIEISTRQLAKSQKTWFKKNELKISYNPLQDKEKVVNEMLSFLKNN